MTRAAVLFEKPKNLIEYCNSVSQIQFPFAQEYIFIQLKSRKKEKIHYKNEQLMVKNLFTNEKVMSLNLFTSIFLTQTKLDTFLLKFIYEPKSEDSHSIHKSKIVSFIRVKLYFELFILNSKVYQIFRFELNKTIKRIQEENISQIIAVENESYLYSQNLKLISRILNVPIQTINLK